MCREIGRVEGTTDRQEGSTIPRYYGWVKELEPPVPKEPNLTTQLIAD
jgi:hypothetical protein